MRKFKVSDRKQIKSVMKGNKLANPASVIVRYRKRLSALVKRMTVETTREIKKLFDSKLSDKFFEKQKLKVATDESLSSQARILTNSLLKKFQQIFSEKSSLYAWDMVDQVNSSSDKSVERSLGVLSGGLSIKGTLSNVGITEINNAIVAENVSLIKSIPVDYMKNIQGKVMRSIAAGDLQDLNESLSTFNGISERKVKNMADDQVRKSFNAVTKERLTTHGVKAFEWLHSGGGQNPRQDHIDMDGEIFYFDDLPIIDKRTGEKGIPGQAINCRCAMNPIIELESED